MRWAELLSAEEIALVGRSIEAVVKGPFFEDWEFHSLFGWSREDVQRLLHAWPNVDSVDTRAVLVNVLNNLVGYPNKDVAVWRKYVSCSKEDLATILAKVVSDS